MESPNATDRRLKPSKSITPSKLSLPAKYTLYIFMVLIFIIGLILLSTSFSQRLKQNGTVTKMDRTYITITYTVKDKTLTKTIPISSISVDTGSDINTVFAVGTTHSIYYNKYDASDAILDNKNVNKVGRAILGIILMVGSVFGGYRVSLL